MLQISTTKERTGKVILKQYIHITFNFTIEYLENDTDHTHVMYVN